MADDALEDLRHTAKSYAPDAYVTALLAPSHRQRPMIALAAFLGDVERIVTTLSDPAIAEIRLQWWRDAIRAAPSGFKTGHPGADALADAVSVYELPFETFDALLDARALDLYADPLPSEAAFDAYLIRTDGAAFNLFAKCLGSADAAQSPLIAHAARACATARLIAQLPVFLARGRTPFPGVDAADPVQLHAALDHRRSQARDALNSARGVWRTCPQPDRAACLSLALVEPYLKGSNRAGHDPAKALTQVEPLTRMWRMWQAHALGRF
ncbi:MAG: squalene/phytoene synthase family protein [Hyphomicrobiaceae bacterium]